MRTALLAAAAAVSLLAGCREADDAPANNVAAKDSPVFPVTDDNPEAVPAPPATREAALKLMHDRHEGMEDIGDATKALAAR